MTAMTLLVQPKRRAAYLMSDTAVTATDGRVMRFQNKIMRFDRFPAAIGMQGTFLLYELGAEIQAADPRNLRSLLAAMPGAMKRVCAKFQGEVVAVAKMAAYSTRERRPCGYIITNNATMALSMTGDAGRTFEVIEVHNSPSYDAPLAEVLCRPCEIGDLNTFDPQEHTFELIGAERRRGQTVVAPGFDEAIAHRIGGGAELTEVTRHGVKVWGCGEFPDRVGELIAP